MNERAIDHALLEALSKADPGPYPKRIPYAAAIVRQFLPNPVTAFRWATYTAAGTVVLGGVALVVKAMGIDHMGIDHEAEAPPLASVEAPHDVLHEVVPEVAPAPAEVPAAVVAAAPVKAASVVEIVVPPSQPEQEGPVALAATSVDDPGKVTVVQAVHEPRHAAPDLGLNLLGMKVAVDLT